MKTLEVSSKLFSRVSKIHQHEAHDDTFCAAGVGGSDFVRGVCHGVEEMIERMSHKGHKHHEVTKYPPYNRYNFSCDIYF